MKHARPDYAPIQDPRGKIPDDEPVFLLRGQDPAAVIAVRVYANAARMLGAHEVGHFSDMQATAMEEWQARVKQKTPDLDPGGAPFDPLRDGKPPAHRPLVAFNPQSCVGKEPCGECHLREGETCDICGARRD